MQILCLSQITCRLKGSKVNGLEELKKINLDLNLKVRIMKVGGLKLKFPLIFFFHCFLGVPQYVSMGQIVE